MKFVFCSFSLEENEPKELSVSIAPRETDGLCAKDSSLVWKGGLAGNIFSVVLFYFFFASKLLHIRNGCNAVATEVSEGQKRGVSV